MKASSQTQRKANVAKSTPEVEVNIYADSVRHSRAGDQFHYRWAARRCLRLLDFRSSLSCVTIESSSESHLDGEYAIDLTEYSKDVSGKQEVVYYQLKHSTIRAKKPFSFSELEKTIEAFAKRHSQLSRAPKTSASPAYSFHLITNRVINKDLKQSIVSTGEGRKTGSKLRVKMEKATGLSGSRLQAFCKLIHLVDDEGDYVAQKRKLRGEVEEYLAGFVSTPEISSLIELVVERALPKSNGEIRREDVLNCLEITSERMLFPAPPEFETVPHILLREQHQALVKAITQDPRPLLVHAEGGVGKSVVARQVTDSLPKGSIGIVYDCFGSGKYRNASEPRHRASEALVQIANELASKGLCQTLVCRANTPTNQIFRDFKDRIDQAAKSVRQVNSSALVVLLIDAADNSEMVAGDANEACFAKALLRETLTQGARLVEFCRTERIELLDPEDLVRRFELKPFSKSETAIHLRGVFPKASDHDVLEFHRLTGGNARVQANALYGSYPSISTMLTSLGPSPTTVADQIANQLQGAIDTIKKSNTPKFQRQVEAICVGLANLPPFIPLEVLAVAAQVDISTIKSFVSDLKRPLWQSDNSVQFRDEPTETWFRAKFGAAPTQIRKYVLALEPLAEKYTYVATALPQLLLKSENYGKLISLALSDKLLPTNNPIDERDVRVYRLQFAFRASLKAGRLVDATRIAFRAGEEVAGDKRQLELLAANTDLVSKFQEPHKVQELAYRRSLGGNWRGSNNVYSSAILSSIEDFKGEARGYLRAAEEWLRIYFEERAKLKEEHGFHREPLNDADLVEFACSYRNLFGSEAAVNFLTKWNPPEVVFRLARIFVGRLVDAAAFDEITEVARLVVSNAHLIVALSDELSAVGRHLPQKYLVPSLNLLCQKVPALAKAEGHELRDFLTPAIVSFAEACAAGGCSKRKIAAILNHYVGPKIERSIVSVHEEGRRTTFFRALALKLFLRSEYAPDPAAICEAASPKSDDKSHENAQEKREFLQIAGALLPWYLHRARLIGADPLAAKVDLTSVRSATSSSLHGRYHRYDTLPYEMYQAEFRALTASTRISRKEAELFAQNVINHKEIKLKLGDRVDALYVAVRSPHLALLRSALESSCSNLVGTDPNESPEERSGWYIRLARAVLPASTSDSSAYFDKAVESASKFGDELVDRWEALVSVAKRAAQAGKSLPEHAYRFIRCAEMVGNTVSREKYWNRDDAVRTTVRLNNSTAFAAQSRWRDRNVGWFNRQIYALVQEGVGVDAIDPVVGWCLSGFLGCNGDWTHLSHCIHKITDKKMRDRVLDQGLRDLELADVAVDKLVELKSALSKIDIHSPRLDTLIGARVKNGERMPKPQTFDVGQDGKKDKKYWNRIFKNRDLLQPKVVREALNQIKVDERHWHHETFWAELIRRIPTGKESDFLKCLPLIQDLSYIETGSAIGQICKSWLGKAAVKRGWREFLVSVGRRHAFELSNRYRLMFWIETYDPDENFVAALREGIYQGLADAPYLADSEVFFGFISRSADQLSTSDALILLDYALDRFDLHIAPDFGDGPWKPWLKVPPQASRSVTGLIWAALGSPFASVRWEAAHCVRRLVEFNCVPEIESLLTFIEDGSVGAFGAKSLPFYGLHAKMYLLLGLSRGAIASRLPLRSHAKLMVKLALSGMPHIFIQKTAADIALRLVEAEPKLLSKKVVEELRKIGNSQFPQVDVKGRHDWIDTPWHKNGKVDLSLQHHFDLDFERYWLGNLGHVFSVSQKQVAELAREVAVNVLGVPGDGNYQPDPRQDQWNSLDRDWRYTSINGSSYPRVDRLSFYNEYHSLLSVAAKLLASMPVAIYRDYDDDKDPWKQWLRRHYLVRLDQKWICDRRDPCPTRRRAWTRESEEKNWLWKVTAGDFYEVLNQESSHFSGVCVSGHWQDHRGDWVESISVASALVSPGTSGSLAQAFRQSHPHDFRLPNYEEDNYEIKTKPFELVGWIAPEDGSGDRLDSFDPYSCGIGIPSRKIGDSFVSLLNLSPEERGWRAKQSGVLVATNSIWSNKDFDDRDKPYRYGEHLVSSVEVLKQLCAKTGKFLLFEVQITRNRFRGQYSSRSDDHEPYATPSHKIFIFTPKGYFHDAEKRHKIG